MRPADPLALTMEEPRVASEEDFAQWRHAHRMAVEAARVLFDQQMLARWRNTQVPPRDGDAAVHVLALRAADLYALCFPASAVTRT